MSNKWNEPLGLIGNESNRQAEHSCIRSLPFIDRLFPGGLFAVAPQLA
jgi:hypothetical protein